jgi:hypothetical protein
MTHSTNQKSELMQQALTLWQKLTGIDPEATRVSMRDWDTQKTFKQVQEAIDLDSTELTATLLLSHFVQEYIKSRTVTFDVLLRTPDAIVEHLGVCRDLLAILDRPDVTERRIAFTEGLLTAIKHYDAHERDEVKKLLSEPHNLAILRRDALRSVKELRVDQFLDGQPEPADVKPVYAKVVHQWWNVNSMLQAAPRIPSGVSLNLVRHPDGYHSYFAFLIRNGANIFILSDVPKFAHPLQASMSRRPDRDLDERMCRNWFPYDLLGLQFDEESNRLFIKQTQERGLVAYQNDALPLSPISEIGAPELVWLSMMFDLIVERFWHQGYKAPALSYTAEMLRSEDVLIEAAQHSNLPVTTYKKLGLPRLTHVDLASENVSEAAVGKKYDNDNEWMEKRYGAQVPEDVFNLVTSPEKKLMISHATGEIVEQPNARDLHSWDIEQLAKTNTLVETVNATSFASKAQLKKDRLFVARCNFADAIEALANKEYEQRKDEVLKWFQTRLAANMKNILKWAGNEEVLVADGVSDHFTRFRHAGRCYQVKKDGNTHFYRSIIDRISMSEKSRLGQFVRYFGQFVHQKPACVIHHNKPSFEVLFSPTNPAELAWLAGCSVEELPDVLQHWNQFEKYRGNCILDRIDPMLWRAHNPWKNLDLRFKLAFSKRAMAEIIKNAEIPDLPNRVSAIPKSS